MFKPLRNLFDRPGQLRLAKLAFPDDEDVPAGSRQLSPSGMIAFPIAREFRPPVIRTTGGDGPSRGTVMAVPEAAVDNIVFRRGGDINSGVSGRV
jgi:hypothetical protein